MRFSHKHDLLAHSTQILLDKGKVYKDIVISPPNIPVANTAETGCDEFDKHYSIWCQDSDYLHAIITGEVRDCLLCNPDWRVELGGSRIKIDKGRKLEIDEIKNGIEFICQLGDLIPDPVELDEDAKAT